MTLQDPHDHDNDLEDPELIEFAERLRRDRPVPRAAYRGTLRQSLMRDGSPRSRPPRLWMLVTASATSGFALLALAALGAAGSGPLAA